MVYTKAVSLSGTAPSIKLNSYTPFIVNNFVDFVNCNTKKIQARRMAGLFGSVSKKAGRGGALTRPRILFKQNPSPQGESLGPLLEGKRSAVAVVNDSPVGCQSCDRAARRRLSALADWGSILLKEGHPLRPGYAGPPPLRGEAWGSLTV